MEPAGSIVSIQIGPVRVHGTPGASDPWDRPWRTGFFKDPVQGSVDVFEDHLDGDGQADRRFHGGADKAILAYAESHYPSWRAELNLPDLPYGAFAENLTLAGQDESNVCLGDLFEIGGVVRVQVSQPRQPCGNISRRWRVKDLTARVKANGKSGWYLRVMKTGRIVTGMRIELVERPFPHWTVARAIEINNNRRTDHAAALELSECPVLSRDWREMLGHSG